MVGIIVVIIVDDMIMMIINVSDATYCPGGTVSGGIINVWDSAMFLNKSDFDKIN